MVMLLGESQLQKKEEFKARKFLVLITILPRIRAVLPLIPSHRIIAELYSRLHGWRKLTPTYGGL